ncbi:hypothetical protein A7A78_03415 [Aequorivita soesokkakensis]|uniref:Uncharacterized protein n=1 Tax=Aequorivita soesokkakensis TaxID=1385699 RepID=A0A1A9LE52_9FLAO|nr:hypothetical protein [Aequorivita soesokkakensis]OAD91550.1 hypothetical protein A7A78_03415 [Aequorivita soesokkakensis]
MKKDLKLIVAVLMMLSFINAFILVFMWHEGRTILNSFGIFFLGFIQCSIWGGAIALLTSLVPYKNYKYSKKFIYQFLVISILLTLLAIIYNIYFLIFTKYIYS